MTGVQTCALRSFGNSNVRIAGAGGGDIDTTRDLSNLTGIPRSEIEALPAYVFYAKRGAGDAVRFRVPSFLTDGKNAMSESEWERVKRYQIERYYAHIDGSRPYPEKRADNEQSHPTQETSRKPLNFN